MESATATDNRHLRRQIRELQDSVETYTRRLAELDRRNADLSAEVERTRASLSASREAAAAASLLRDRQTLASETYRLSASATNLGAVDTVEYSDEEVEEGEQEGIDDVRRRSGVHYSGTSGTQTVDRYRNRNRQR